MQYRRTWRSGLAAVTAALLLSAAARADFRDFERVPIQHNGRVKPLGAFAVEHVQLMTGKRRWQGKAPAAVILQLLADRGKAPLEALVRVDFPALRSELGLSAEKTFFSFQLLQPLAFKIEALVSRAQAKRDRDERPEQLEQKAELLYSRLLALRGIISGEAIAVVPPAAAGAFWSSPYTDPDSSAHAWFALIEAYGRGAMDEFTALSQAWRTQVSSRIAPDLKRTLLLEAHYVRAQPFRLSWLAYLAAFALLAARRGRGRIWSGAGILLFAVGFSAQTYGLGLRTAILGRPPVSNMYESMLFMTWALAFFAGLFCLIRREAAVLSASALASAVVVIYSSLLPLDDSLEVLVPVLRSNYWLTIHVLTIVASYGAMGLAMALGHRHFFLKMRGRLPQETGRHSAHLIYRTLQLGVVLLGAGTVLGGIWANLGAVSGAGIQKRHGR